MRKPTRLIAIILVVSYATLAQTQANKPSKAEQQILALNREWTDSMVNGNVAALERLSLSFDSYESCRLGTVSPTR